MTGFWRRFFLEQFHYSKFCFVHKDWKAFVYTPWLPQTPKYQLIYLIYRWSIALYFLGWLIAAGVTTTYGSKYLIFMTYWNFVLFTGHHLFFALCCTYAFLKVIFCDYKYINKEKDAHLTPSSLNDPPHHIKSCCLCCQCLDKEMVSWYHILLWVGHYLATVVAIPIIVFYWGLIAGQVTGWAVNFHIHLFVAIPGLIDSLVTRLPWRLYHAYVPMLFGVAYFLFSLIYDILGGTNQNGNPYIYAGLDYSSNPTMSIGFMILLIFLVFPFVHFLYWLLHVLRTFLLYHRLKKHENHIEILHKRTRKVSEQPFLSANHPDTPRNNTSVAVNPLGQINELALELDDMPAAFSS